MITERFEQALAYTVRVHDGQVRKGTEIPYVAHLLSVAALVLEDGGSEDEAIAALLHDSIEDRGHLVDESELRRLFGAQVARIVRACSDTDQVPKPPWRARKQAHIEHLRAAPDDVLRVALADKLHNARSILYDRRVVGDAVWSRFGGGREGTLWYYGSLAELFLQRRPGPLSEELARTVDQLADS